VVFELFRGRLQARDVTISSVKTPPTTQKPLNANHNNHCNCLKIPHTAQLQLKQVL